MSQIYKIDYYKLVRWLVPPFLMQKKLLALLKALLTPVPQLYARFTEQRAKNIYTLAHGTQVVYMQKVLNERFDPSNKRIRIADGKLYNQVYIYATEAGLPLFLEREEPTWLFSSAKYKEGHFDFIVVLNNAKVSETELFELRALVDKYKLAGKRYKIIDNE